mgnify:CR=1 FL=1
MDKVVEDVTGATVFAIGLAVDSAPPFAVQKVRDLRSPDGRSLADKVKAGDRLSTIDGLPVSVRLAPGLPLESTIYGPGGTTIRLGFTKSDGARPFELHALRHVPINPHCVRSKTKISASAHAHERRLTAGPEIVAGENAAPGSARAERYRRGCSAAARHRAAASPLAVAHTTVRGLCWQRWRRCVQRCRVRSGRLCRSVGCDETLRPPPTNRNASHAPWDVTDEGVAGRRRLHRSERSASGCSSARPAQRRAPP